MKSTTEIHSDLISWPILCKQLLPFGYFADTEWGGGGGDIFCKVQKKDCAFVSIAIFWNDQQQPSSEMKAAILDITEKQEHNIMERVCV